DVGHRNAGRIELLDPGDHELGIEGSKHNRVGLAVDDLVDEPGLLRGSFAARNEMHDLGAQRRSRDLPADAYASQNWVRGITGEGRDGFALRRADLRGDSERGEKINSSRIFHADRVLFRRSGEALARRETSPLRTPFAYDVLPPYCSSVTCSSQVTCLPLRCSCSAICTISVS